LKWIIDGLLKGNSKLAKLKFLRIKYFSKFSFSMANVSNLINP